MRATESINATIGKCLHCGQFFEAEPVAYGIYSLPEQCCGQTVIPIHSGSFTVGMLAYHRTTKTYDIVEAVTETSIMMQRWEAGPRQVLQYVVDGDCIVAAGVGGVLYDCLEDMPLPTRYRLAELSTAHSDWDWERAEEELVKEGYAISKPAPERPAPGPP
ncbi:MAG: hypothetical protein JNM09_01015 [Blastocatellia bacterium]|nr:hypothetical protein [Blastocatellia bacterium]